MNSGTVCAACSAIGRKQRLLQHVVEHTATGVYEIDGDRGRLRGEQRAQFLEILAREKTRWRHIGNDTGRFRPSQSNVGEHAVHIGMSVETSLEALTLLDAERYAAVRRISHDKIIQSPLGS